MLNVRWSQLIFWTYLHDDNDRPVYLQPEGKILLGERIHIREDHDDEDDIWMKVLQDLYSQQHVQTLQLLKEPYFHISGILKGTQSIKPFPYPREPKLFCQFFVSSPGHLLPTIWSSANQVKTKVQEANAKLEFKLELPSPSPLWPFFTPSQTIFTPNQTNFWKKYFKQMRSWPLCSDDPREMLSLEDDLQTIFYCWSILIKYPMDSIFRSHIKFIKSTCWYANCVKNLGGL